ncbi:TonB-dependent receptor [Corallococcus praedator]|uniref:TonB-dependent receptor n=1 Tax=Corallococcus praedator TaxID=2316724 RepID=A0ABX9QLB6_9BACT|nr:MULTISPECIES: TonB-dependent receptor [Corallococcus]RKH31652.1 TonB-dependent receptor [Corallococcus sp. CA031C]RKI10720.1 TonB-dependent receptor [Corallococcus praedator]
MDARTWAVAVVCFVVSSSAPAQAPAQDTPPPPPSEAVPVPAPEAAPASPPVSEQPAPEPAAAAPAEPAASVEPAAPSEQVPAPAAAPVVEAAPEGSRKFESVVVGTSETKTSGSIHILKPEKLQRYELDDPQAILQSVPGVYGRGEDGFGLRPNLGLRGVNPDRSKKVTLLEDGILFGPAPYSAPAAYYFPLMTRMQSVRVLKGPSSIQQGPQTVGGSVDLITRDIPAQESFGLDLAGGQYLYGKAHGYFGASTERAGFLIEGVHLRSNGFKDIDNSDASTGFHRNEWMAKARYRLVPDGDLRQTLQLKLGYSDEGSNETYLGLSDADFAANPLRRYKASQFDHMQWHRTQAVLSHVLEGRDVAVTTSLYRQDLDRTWRKVNSFRGISISDVLADPTSARNAIYYGVLTGELDSSTPGETILIGPNHRVFVSQGLQSVARWTARTGPLSHNAEFGVRYHYDSIDRRHTQDGFLMVGGELVPEGGTTQVTADNKDSTHALALHATDAIAWGPLVVTPGVRLEIIRSKSHDKLAGTVDHGSLEALMPGVGVYGALTPVLGLFAGAYRGFSPPAPGQPQAVSAEKSINYEAGARWSRRGERFEVVGFFNDYSNLTDVCTFSNGCLNDNLDRQVDAGAANIYGLEAFAEKTFRPGGGLTFPLTASYTFTRTKLLNDFRSSDPQFGNVVAGDELPYVPRHQLYASVGVEGARWGAFISTTYLASMREEAGQGEIPEGVKTGALLTFDVNASWNITRWGQLYVSGRNLLDEAVIVGRRPYGARPNAPRTLIGGFKVQL